MDANLIKRLNTKKLKALLATADERDCIKIQKELASRGEPVILSEEAPVLSEAKLKEKFEEMQRNAGRVVRVRRTGDIAWTEAQIVGAVYDKQAGAFIYRIRTIDGGLVKRHENSENMVFTDQFRPLVKKWRGYAPEFLKAKTLTPEEAEELRLEKSADIGRYAKVRISETEVHYCILQAVRADRKRNTVHYIFSDLDVMGRPLRRSIDAEGIEFEDKYDEDMKADGRRRSRRKPVTPQDKLHVLEIATQEAEERFLRAKSEYESVKAEYEAFLAEFLEE